MIEQISQFWQSIPEFVLWIIASIIGALIVWVLVFSVRHFVARSQKQEKKERNLEWHFNNLVRDLIEPVISMVDKLRILNGEIMHEWTTVAHVPFPKSFDFEENELYEAFKAHYPKEENTWTKLKERSIGQNKAAEMFEGKIKEHIESNPDLPPIQKDPIPDTGGKGNPARAMIDKAKAKANMKEMIVDLTPKRLCQALLQIANGRLKNIGFNDAKVESMGSFYVLKFDIVVGMSHLAYTSTIEKAKSCKSVLVKIQESPEFRRKASEIIQDAKRIKSEFEYLKKELNDMKFYGLRSDNRKYKFEKVKNCPICQKF